MDINQIDLRAKLVSAASKIVNPEEAAYFADELIETHLRKSNVSNPLKQGIGDLEACIQHKATDIEYSVDLPAYKAINFRSHGPLPYIKRIHDDLETRAQKCGIAMTAFTNSQSMHTLHNWVQGLAKRGLVALAVCNGGPAAVVPHNGTKGVFGTNPLAYGFTDADGSIHCVDMATSEVAYFEILNAKAEGRPLAENVAVNDQGEPTTDPTAALDYSLSHSDPIANLLPLGGGYKGQHLIYLLEMLTSGLIGAKSSPEMSADYVAEEHGSFLLVFHPGAMGTTNTLHASIKHTHNTLEAQTPKTGHQITLPGQGNNERYAATKEQPISVDETLLNRLNKLL